MAELTLYDADRYRKKGESLYRGVVDTFLFETDFTKQMPWETTGTTQVSTQLTNSLPNTSWRARGDRYTGGKTGYTFVSDSTYALGAEIDIDNVELEDKQFGSAGLKREIESHTKSIAYEINDTVINGNHGTDPNQPIGLNSRISNLAASQTVYGTSSSSELDLRAVASPSDADYYQFFDRIDEAMYVVDGHMVDVVLTDADFMRTMQSAARRINKEVERVDNTSTVVNERFTQAKPAQKFAVVYNGIKFIDMGVKKDQTTKVVATDTVNGAACRPAYFVRFGDNYFQGIQEYPLKVIGPFQLDAGTGHRVVIDWTPGFKHVHPRFGSVLRGVRVA